jgi:hypothetical protein
MLINQQLRQFNKKKKTTVVFILMVMIFSIYAFYIALHLQPDIIPDEPAHFLFAKHFSTTWGIPPDTMETSYWGWYIQQNPFFYHWLNGRYINLITQFNPLISDQEILIFLRIINVLYSFGTITFCYLISIEIIKHKWWQLLPVFLLTNTLMFVFLAGGLNYDNLANLLSLGGLYFFVRVLKHKNFLKNSLVWMILISVATLVKFTILPLALALGVSWIVFLILERNQIFPLYLKDLKIFILLCILFCLVFGNFLIYGINLIRYQSIRPSCNDILDQEYCVSSRFYIRHEEKALENKLSVNESINQGFPNPIEYVTNVWPRLMLLRTFGIPGHEGYKVYSPVSLVDYFQILLYSMIIISFLFWRKPSFLLNSLIGISFFYTIVLIYQNYQSELVYGFLHFAFQGRYIFPVIGPIYILFTKILKATPSKYIRWAILIFTIGLFIYGGLLSLILKYDTVFSSWFH